LTRPPVPGGPRSDTVLHSFGGRPDGANPLADLIFGQAGQLIGTTTGGGIALGCGVQPGCGGGTVFTLSPPAIAGGAWTESFLYKFTSNTTDGSNPAAGLVAATSGVLYGTTASGDINYGGTVFKLVPPGTSRGHYTESIVHRFLTGTMDGYSPEAGLVFKTHELYGTTSNGGAVGFFDTGTVFEVTP